MKALFSIRNLYFTTVVGIFVYLVLRAINVPPVHDEAATYLHYIQRFEWMPYKAHWDANNHILNSLLSGLIFKIFGQGLLWLRLASLLFFPVYVFYTWKIGSFIKSKTVLLGFLLGMLTIHNLMEYFAYSRGYAMSMALLIGAIYYVMVYLKTFELKKLWPFYLLATLALAANLTLVNTVLILNGFLLVSFFLKGKQWGIKFLFVILGLTPIVLAGILSMDMKKIGLLYYGGDSGFWSMTVWSLVILIYGAYTKWVALFFVLVTVLSVLFFFFKPKGAGGFFSHSFLVAGLFVGNIVAIFLLQLLLKVNYPEDRTAMYLYFLLVLFFAITLDHVKMEKLKYLAFIWVLVPIHFIFQVNLSQSAYWHYEHLPYRFYTEIKSRAGDHPEEVSVGGYKLMNLIWAYYNQLNGGVLNDMQKEDYPGYYYDFLLMRDSSDIQKALPDYQIVDVDPISNIHLLERKKKLATTQLVQYNLPDVHKTRDEYIGFFDNDSLRSYPNLCFDISCNVQNSNHFLFGIFTLGINQNGEEVIHYNQELHYARSNWKEGQAYHHRIFVQGVPENAERIVVYLWNKNKQEVTVSNIQVAIYSWKLE